MPVISPARKQLCFTTTLLLNASKACSKSLIGSANWGNDSFSIESFVPSTISNDVSINAGTTETSYYSYRDSAGTTWRLRDVRVKYSHLSSGMIAYSGALAKNRAEAFVNYMVSAIGTISKTVSVFGWGKSLYDWYAAVRGPVQYSSGEDYTSSSVIFDRIEKESQYYVSTTQSYATGKISHKTWTDRLDTYQYYAATGEAEFFQPTVNVEHYSQYWENNEKTISRCGWEDYHKAKLYDTIVVMSGTN